MVIFIKQKIIEVGHSNGNYIFFVYYFMMEKINDKMELKDDDSIQQIIREEHQAHFVKKSQKMIQNRKQEKQELKQKGGSYWGKKE